MLPIEIREIYISSRKNRKKSFQEFFSVPIFPKDHLAAEFWTRLSLLTTNRWEIWRLTRIIKFLFIRHSLESWGATGPER